MRRTQSLWVFLFTVAVTACASPKIGYDYDSSANFSAYRTYEWMPGIQETTGDKRVDNSLVDSRIRTAVGSRLRAKGYTTSLNGKPDFYVAYHVGVKDMVADVTQHFSDEHAPRLTTRSSSGAPTGGEPQPYTTGTLLIDIIDAASNKLAWRGTAAGEVDPGLTSEERDERIRTIVHEMLSHFPPK